MRHFSLFLFLLVLFHVSFFAQATSASNDLQVNIVAPPQVAVGDVFTYTANITALTTGELQLQTIYDKSRVKLISGLVTQSFAVFSGSQNVTLSFQAISPGTIMIGTISKLQVNGLTERFGNRIAIQIK